MAENSDQSRKAAPSLMARASDEAEEDGSHTRILAGLQGRLPVRTASTRKVSHTKRYILILLVLLLFIGVGLITFMIGGNGKPTPPITIATASGKLRTDTKSEMNGHGSVAAGNRLNPSADTQATAATIVDAPVPTHIDAPVTTHASGNAVNPASSSPLTVALASHASDLSLNNSSSAGQASSAAGHSGSETNVGGKVSDPIGEIISANNTGPAGDANAADADASHTGPAISVANEAAASESHRASALHGASPTPVKTNAKANGKASIKTSAKTKHVRAHSDTDVALLTALLSQGLPSPTSVHGKSASPRAIATAQVLPGSSLSERLKACHQLSWLSGERCRLDVCSGHWGIAPECPSAQPQTEQ